MSKRQVAVIAAVIGSFSSAGRAQTMDWRFCVASDMNARVAYLTPNFESAEGHRALESKVGALLARLNLPYQNVQCRLPVDELSSRAERADAEAFVKALGLSLKSIQ